MHNNYLYFEDIERKKEDNDETKEGCSKMCTIFRYLYSLQTVLVDVTNLLSQQFLRKTSPGHESCHLQAARGQSPPLHLHLHRHLRPLRLLLPVQAGDVSLHEESLPHLQRRDLLQTESVGASLANRSHVRSGAILAVQARMARNEHFNVDHGNDDHRHQRHVSRKQHLAAIHNGFRPYLHSPSKLIPRPAARLTVS